MPQPLPSFLPEQEAGPEGIAARVPTVGQSTPCRKTPGLSLLRQGLVAPHDLVRALALQHRQEGRLTDILMSRQIMGEPALCAALAQHWAVCLADPLQSPPDPRLIDRAGAAFCLKHRLLPLHSAGGVVVVAAAHPEEFEAQRSRLALALGPVVMALAAPSAIEQAILKTRGHALVAAAETRVSREESCRRWGQSGLAYPLAAVVAALLLALWLSPLAVAALFAVWAVLTLLFATALRIAAVVSTLRHKTGHQPATTSPDLPVVSVMVALFKEGDIAARLIGRLSRIDYPRALLEVLLVVEAEDHVTRKALAEASLPPWFRIVIVPDSALKTKPRALNFGLSLCRGSVIGVYDAEDAPASDQIRKVVARFEQRGPEVACLQGVLDFYNPRTNWLSRCFTMEYATWFRIILPGLQRMGMAIPLGGTTLFFRREALERLGAWDAFNVTEDADLGMRLARHGYRAELLDTVTEEEANCRTLPWIKQRSRWLKGYMMTYAVHMRKPRLLWRQLGPRQFLGFQVLFLCTLSQFLLAPLLWSFWALPLGLPHPLAQALPATVTTGLMLIYLITELTNITATYLAMRMTRHKMNPLWILTLHFYFPLGALASYKAAWEMVTRPFYWDKTSHGHFDQ